MKFSQIRKNYPKAHKIFSDYIFSFVKNESFTFILKDDNVYSLTYHNNKLEHIEFELYLGIILRFFLDNGLKIHALNTKMVNEGFSILEGKLIKEGKQENKCIKV